MKSMNSYIIYILAFFAIGFSSCMEEEVAKEAPSDGKTLCISINAESPIEVIPTKSAQSMANDIQNLCVLIYDVTSGELQVAESEYYDETSEVVKALNGETAKKELLLQIEPGRKVIRLLSGCGDVREDSDYSTLNKLEKKTFEVSTKEQVSLPQLISYGEGDQEFDVSTTSTTVTANLKRIYSMITVVIDNKVTGAVISPEYVKLCHVPSKGSLVTNKIPGAPSESDYVEEAELIRYGSDWNHEAAVTPAFFMYENMQGDNAAGNTDQTMKTPPALGKPISSAEAVKQDKTCSYIEVKTNYKQSAGLSDGDPNTGTVIYRFFLGTDILNNFDVTRNTHYKVTLALSGDGGIKEGTWRVETDILSDFTVDDVYIGFKKGSNSVGNLNFGNNDSFFKECIWKIEDITPASGTMFGNAKADKGSFVNQPTIDITTKTLSFVSDETNVYERWPRYKVYRITATKDGKSVSKTMRLFQVTRILEPIGYFKRAGNVKTEEIRVKEYDLISTSYKTINSAGAWKAEVEYGGDWVQIGKFGTDENVSVSGNVVSGAGGNVQFTYTPKGTAAAARYGCIRVKYHNNQCEHKIYLRQGNDGDIELIKDKTIWAFGNLVENSEAGILQGTKGYGIAKYATQPGPLFQGGANKGVSSIAPEYNGGQPAGWTSTIQTNWGTTTTGNSTSQGPCPSGYRLPSVRDFTILRQQFFTNTKFTVVVGYLHDDDENAGWSWSWDKSEVNVWSQSHSNPAKGTLFVNEGNNYVNLFFPFGNGVLKHEKIDSRFKQSYDSGLDEIGVGWRISDGKLHFEEDYRPTGSTNVQNYEGYGGTYWSGTKSLNDPNHSLYMKLWYFLNRDVPVYVSDGSNRWGDSVELNKRGATGVTRTESMFLRCVKKSMPVDSNFWDNR